MNKKLIHLLLLIAGIILALFLNKDLTLLSLATTAALIFGFINIYFTINRSKWFIIPDLLWILATMVTLVITNNYADIWYYIFCFGIGFYQFYDWSKHETDGQFIVVYARDIPKETFIWFCIGLIIMFMIIGLDTAHILESENLWLGAIISGFGIIASIMLARRQYFSYVYYVIGDVLQIILYARSDLGALILIPTIFLIFSILFLWENRLDFKTK